MVVTTGMTAVAQADLSDTGCHDLHIQGAKSKYVNFPKGFVFLMGGVPHAGVWVHGNGYVSFGGVGMPDSSPTPAELLGRADEFSLETGMMRIAPLGTDLNPNPSDRGRVYAGAVGSRFPMFRSVTSQTSATRSSTSCGPPSTLLTTLEGKTILGAVNPTFHSSTLDWRFSAAGHRYFYTGARAGRQRPRS